MHSFVHSHVHRHLYKNATVYTRQAIHSAATLHTCKGVLYTPFYTRWERGRGGDFVHTECVCFGWPVYTAACTVDGVRYNLPPPWRVCIGGVGLGWVGSRPRLVAYPRSAPPSLRDPTGRPYPGVRSQGLPDC